MTNHEEYWQEESVDLRDYLNIIYRYRYLVLTLFVLTIGAAAFFSLRTPPTYEAEATVKLALKQPQLSVLPEATVIGGRVDPVASEIEVIKSRTLAKRVVRKLGWGIWAEKLPEGVTIEDVFVQDNTPSSEYILSLKANGTFSLRPDGRSGKEKAASNAVLQGEVGKPFEGPGFRFTLNAPVGLSFETKLYVRTPSTLAGDLRERIRVSQKGNTDIAAIRAQAGDPEEAARIANTYAETYVEYTLEDNKRVARSIRQFTESQLKKVEQELAAYEQALTAMKDSIGAYSALAMEDPTGSAGEIFTTLNRLEIELATALAERDQAQNQLAVLEEELKDRGSIFGQYRQIASDPVLTNNPEIASLRAHLVDLQLQKARLLEQYTENHPQVIQLTHEIAQTEKQLNDAIRTVVSSTPSISDPVYQTLVNGIIEQKAKAVSLDAKIQALRSLIASYEQRVEGISKTALDYKRLERKVNAQSKVYELLLTKLQEARIAEAQEVGDAKVIDMAEVPSAPVSPRTRTNILLGALLGLMLGIGGAFLMEYLDNSVKTQEEVERFLGVPVLGTVPFIQVRERVEDEAELIERRLITHTEPRSPISEAYRSIRTSLRFLSVGNPPRSLVITSTIAREGKSSTVANVAVTLAQMGSRVLLVDADMRNPMLHKVFGVGRGPGFADYFTQLYSPEDLVKEISEIENLYLIPSGKTPPNPAELLASAMTHTFLKWGLENFDYVLFDSPPILPVTDAVELGKKADGVLLVVRAGETDRNALVDAKRILDRANVRVLGAVLNALDVERHYGYYHKYRYSYYYRYGYGYGEGKKARVPDGSAAPLWNRMLRVFRRAFRA